MSVSSSKLFCLRSAFLKAAPNARMLADLGDSWRPSGSTRNTLMEAAEAIPGLAE